MHNVKQTLGIGTEQLSSHINTTNQRVYLEKKDFNVWWSTKIGLWSKVMWSYESRFTLWQSDECIRVWREADEVMHLSSLESPRFCNIMYPKNEVSWKHCMARLFHQWIFPSLMARPCSKMAMPGLICLNLWKRSSGSMTHHFSHMEFRP